MVLVSQSAAFGRVSLYGEIFVDFDQILQLFFAKSLIKHHVEQERCVELVNTSI